MYTIKDIEDAKVLSDFFVNDPNLCYLGLPDDDLVNIYNTGEWKPRNTSYFLGVYKEDKLVCIFKYEYYTSIAMTFHGYLKSEYHHTGEFKKIKNALVNWLLDNTTIRKALVFAPDNCPHVHTAMQGIGMEKEGHIKNALIWRQKKVGLTVYGLDLVKEE